MEQEAEAASLMLAEKLQADMPSLPVLMSIERESPDSAIISGSWGDASRSRNVRNELAMQNKFDKETHKVMKMSTPKKPSFAPAPAPTDDDEEEWRTGSATSTTTF